MKTSNKQIFVVYKCNVIDQVVGVSMITLSIRKLKSFIVKQLKSDNIDIFYDNEKMSKTMQIKEFKSDFKFLTREKINEKLYGLKYDYVYDGEEF